MNIQGIAANPDATFRPQSASSARATTNGSSSSGGSSEGLGSATNLQDTFLNLLVTELQNQDPTSPVDPTQMVAQMVSLNQLDQLIAINSTLTTMAGGSMSATSSSSGSTATARVASGTTAGGEALSQPSSITPDSASPQLGPAVIPDANGMTNLYGTVLPESTAFNNTLLTGGK